MDLRVDYTHGCFSITHKDTQQLCFVSGSCRNTLAYIVNRSYDTSFEISDAARVALAEETHIMPRLNPDGTQRIISSREDARRAVSKELRFVGYIIFVTTLVIAALALCLFFFG
jgi:hypothetical protein